MRAKTGPRKEMTIQDLGLGALLAAVAMLAPGLLPPLAGKQAAAAKPTLAGTWKLDEDLTARLREEDRRARGGGPGFGDIPQVGGGGNPGAGGFPGGPRGGGGGGWGRGRRSGEGGGGPEGQGARESFAALDELTIAQDEKEVRITDAAGKLRTLTTDGRKHRDETAPRGPAEVKASWEKDGTLVVEVRPDEGPRRTESYLVSNDGQHLYVVLDLEARSQRPQLRIRRAYARAEAAPSAASPPPPAPH